MIISLFIESILPLRGCIVGDQKLESFRDAFGEAILYLLAAAGYSPMIGGERVGWALAHHD
jgi:hypothetical protein